MRIYQRPIPIEIKTESSEDVGPSDSTIAASSVSTEIGIEKSTIDNNAVSFNSTNSGHSSSIDADDSNPTFAVPFDPIEINDECTYEELLEILEKNFFEENGELTARGRAVFDVLNRYNRMKKK